MPVEVREVVQAYRFGLAPTPAQQRMFHSHAGAARFAYNWGLTAIQEVLEERAEKKAAGLAEADLPNVPSHFDLCKWWVRHKDTDPELAWVPQNASRTYEAALRDAHAAWANFFRTRRSSGRRWGRPRFRSRRRSKRSFQIDSRQAFKGSDNRHMWVPRVGVVRTCESTRKLTRRLRAGTATLVRGTISQHSDGRWYVAFTVTVNRQIRTGPSARQRAGGVIGLDLGVRSVAVDSRGTMYPNPQPLAGAQARLARAQRVLSRRTAGSARRERARRVVGRIHARVAHLRLDAAHKLTSDLVHGHAVIGVEGWDVAETLARGSKDVPRHVRRRRNRELSDTGIGMIRGQLQSKAQWYGSTVVVVDRNVPTGRTCHACGTVRTKPVPPAYDEFRCPSCGWVGDRRVNTARVVAALAGNQRPDDRGGRESLNARGGDASPTTPQRGGRSPANRVARTQQHRGQTSTPDG